MHNPIGVNNLNTDRKPFPKIILLDGTFIELVTLMTKPGAVYIPNDWSILDTVNDLKKDVLRKKVE